MTINSIVPIEPIMIALLAAGAPGGTGAAVMPPDEAA